MHSTTFLIKIPAIILVNMGYKTIGAHRIASKRALKSEPLVPTSSLDKRIWMDFVLKSYVRLCFFYRRLDAHAYIIIRRLCCLQIFQTIFSSLEIVMILANTFPQYPITHSILSNITFSSDAYSHQPRLTAMSALAAILVAVGIAIRLRAYEDMGDMFTADVTIRKNHRLIKTGTYSIVRHPSYTGYLIAITGWILWNLVEGSWLRESGLLETWYGTIFALVYATFVLLGVPVAITRIPKEDATLKKRFGKEWEEWAKNVPYALFPGIF